MAPGATESARRWAPESFVAAVDRLLEHTAGTVFVIGAGHEAETVSFIQSRSNEPDRVKALSGLPLDQAMALMSLADCVFGNDSGPVNVAAALDKPAYVLCGSSTPAMHSRNLHLILPPDGLSTMEAVSVEQVVEVVLAGLGACS